MTRRDSTWMNDGSCRTYDVAVFFPPDGMGVERAQVVCAGCPVRDRCLEYALDNHIDEGVWGGESERARRRIRAARRTRVPVLAGR